MNLKFSLGVKCLPVLFLSILSLASLQVKAQNCTINAGVNENLCPGTPMVLKGTLTGLVSQSATWSQIAGPAVTIGTVAISPVTGGNSYKANVTGFAPGNTYTFRITARCSDGSQIFQDVTFTTLVATKAVAGSNITSCAGTITLAGNTPGAGETGDWSIITRPYGMHITTSNSPTSTVTLPNDTTATAVFKYTIINPNGCASAASMTVTNISGQSPVNAGTDQTLSNCYNLTQGTQLFASYGGNGFGQQGTWSFVSGPSTPSFGDIHNNRTGVNNLVTGVYTLRWTVAGPCVNGSDEMTITVPPPTQSVTNANNANLIYCDSRTSTVLTGTIPGYTNETGTWTRISGTGTISDPNVPSITVTGLTPPAASTFRYTINNSVTGCTTIGDFRISYAPMTAVVPTTVTPIILPSTATAVSIPYSTTGGNQTYWQLVTGPLGTTLAPSGTTTYQYIDESPIDITGLDKIGTYNFRLLRTTANAGSGGCVNAFADLTVIISQPPTAANAGTTGNVACNIFSTTLAGNDPAVGSGYWSQVDGPNTANIVNIYDRGTEINGLTNGAYTFRWIVTGGQGANDAQSDVIVRVANMVPTASVAGADQVVCNQTPVYLHGNATLLNETGTWTVTPTLGVTFVNINDPNTKVTGLADNSTYTFTWTIANSCNTSISSTHVTTSSNVGPKAAVAGVAQCLSASATTFTLAGNAATGTETGTWSLVSGPNTPTITTPSSNSSTVTGAVNGTYKFEWSLSTPSCSATKDTVIITASAAATVATVTTTPVNLCGVTAVTLAGNTPTVGTGKWTQVGGPGGAVITDPFSPTSTVTGLTAASYIFRWTISNGACSSNSADVKYNISTPPSQPIIGPALSVCAASSVVLNASPVTTGTGIWQVQSGPNTPSFSSFTNPTATLSGLTTGVYTLIWTASNGANCPMTQSAPLSITVTQNAIATVASSGLCNATVALLTGNNGSNGVWTNVSGTPTPTLNQNSNFTAIASGLTNGNYTFRYTLPAVGACVSTSATVSINITASPSPAQAGPDQNLCSATFVTLGADVPSVGTGTWTIISQPGSGASFVNANSPTTNISTATPGVYLLQWNVTNGNCGTNQDIVRITTSAPPTTSAAGANQLTACTGNLTLIANTPTVGLGTWSQVTSMTGTISSPNSPSTSVLGTVPGAYTFMWTISSGSCASSTSIVNVTVTSTPPVPATAGPDQQVCNLSTTTSTVLAGSALNGGETGQWTVLSKPGGTPTFVNANANNTTVSGLIQGTYVLTWTVSNGSCISSSNVTITVTNTPTPANAGPDNSFCLYTPVNLAATAVTVGVGTWSTTSKPGGAPDPVFDDENSNTTAVNGLLAGDYVFTWVTTNGAACATSMSSVTIHIVQPPSIAQAGSFQTVCLGVNPVMTANSPTFGTGTWAVTTSAGGSPAFTNVNAYNTVVTGLVAGVYTFSWTITNGGCTSSDAMQITVQPAVATNGIATAQTICSGGTPVALTGTTATGGDGTTYAYQWQRSTVSALAGFSNITGATSTGFAPGSLTNTTWYRRLVSSGSCSGVAANTSAVAQIIVLSPIAANTLTAPITTTFCQSGDPDVIVGATPTGGDGTYAYQWQVSTVNAVSGFTDVAAATSISYDPPVITSNTWYRRLVTSNACTATSTAVAFTVNPYAVLTSIVSPAAICTGATFSYSPTASIGGTTYAWTRAAVAGINTGLTGSGVQSISETLNSTNTVITPVQYLYSLTTPTGCTNPVAFSVTVNVKPRPNVDLPSSQTLCNGTLTSAITFTGSVVAGTTYTWTNNTTSIGLGASATATTIAAFTATNTTSLPVTAILTVTPVSNACSGATQTFSIVVNPTADVTVMTAVICTGSTFSLTPTDIVNGVIPGGTTFTWPAPTMSGTLTGGLAGSGMLAISGTFNHTNNVAQTATYIITPNTPLCGDSRPFTVTITVLPAPLITDISTTACASVTFTVTPTDPTNGRVPAGTTYKWTAPTGTGFTGGLTQQSAGITSITGNLTNSVSTATTATYVVSPTTGACAGVPFSVIVSLNPKAILTPISITTCSAVPFAITPVDVTNGILPAGTTFTWPLPTGAGLSGLTAQGSAVGGVFGGLTNTTNAAIITTYRVVPLSGGCTGNMLAISVTVNPVAAITAMAGATCSGVTFAITPVNSTNGIVPANTRYAWSAPALSGAITGEAAATNSNSISGTLSISGIFAGTATYIVTPSTAACGNGNPFTVTVTVNPVAIITAMSTIVCGGVSFTFTPTDAVDGNVIPAGTTYSWSAPTGAFTGAASGSGASVITGTLTNNSNVATTATYIVTPRSTGSCNGSPFTITISLNPKAIINPLTASICNGASFVVTPTNGANGIVPLGTTYSWPAPSGAGFTGGVTGSGSNDINGTLANAFSSARTATYFVTPLSGSCTGNTVGVTVTVNPIAAVTDMTGTACSGSFFSFTPVDGTNGTVPANTLYAWSSPAGTGFTGQAAQVTPLSSTRGTLTNTTNAAVTAVYTVTPSTNGCTGAQFTVTVTINPRPSVTPMPQTICSGQYFNITPVNSTNGIVPLGTTYSWSNPVGTGFTGGLTMTTQGGIFGTLTNSNNTVVTATYVVTPTSGSCIGSTFAVTVTINPIAAITAMTPVTCNGTIFTATPTNGTNGIVPAGTTYTWGLPSVTGTLTGGATGSGAANISGTLSHTDNTAQTATYLVTPNIAACGNGVPFTVTVIVSPKAFMNNLTATICSGASFAITPINPNNGVVPLNTRYTWSAPIMAGVTGGVAQTPISVTSITGTLTNAGTAPATATYIVTPVTGSCSGTAFAVTVTVNPIPTLTSTLLPAPICNDGTFIYAATSATVGTAFTWTRTTPGGILPAAPLTGTGDINQAFSSTNVSRTNIPYVYTLTANGCSNTQSFSITINPSPVLSSTVTPPAICNGTTFAYTPTTSATGVTVTYVWTRLPASGVTSGGPSTGTTNISQTLTSSNTVPTAVQYVYTLTANGCTNPNQFTVTVMVNPTATVDQPTSPVIVCAGTLVSAITFTGSPVANTTYTWSNNNTGIGLGSGSTGNIAAFTATNATAVPIVAVITVTPSSNTCNGTALSFSITVNPTATVNLVTDQVRCNGASTAAVIFTGAVANTTYNWTNTTTSIGLAASGSGTISSFAATNASAIPVTAFITVTPASNTCNGSSRTFSITVNPTPTATQVTDQVVCNGTLTTAANFTGFVAGTIYNWTNNTTSIGLAAAGTGTINAFTATNITAAPVTALITVTPLSNACSGSAMVFSITVNPAAALTSTLSPTAICSNTSFSYTPTSAVSGATFAWARNAVSGITSGGPSTGTGNINQTLISSNSVQTNVGYIYTVTANGCTNPLTFTVTVPVSAVAQVNTVSATACAGVAFNIAPVNVTDGIVPTGTRYTWLAPVGTGFSGGTAQALSATSISGTLINTTNTQAIAEYTVTPISGACAGVPFTAVITLNPKAIVTSLTATICSGGTFNVTPSAGIIPAGTTYTWSVPTGSNFTGGLSQTSGVSNVSGTLVNTSSSARTVTYLVTPMSATGSCTGNVFSVTVTVTPVASIGAFTIVTASGTAFEISPVDGTGGIIVPAGTTYSWPAPTVTGGLTGGATGSGASSITGNLTNPTNTAQTATYSVTPLSGSCTGTAFTVTVRISPLASINPITVTTCSGVFFVITPTDVINGNVPAGTTYSWSAPSGTGFTGGAAGSGVSSINGTLTNTTTAPVTATYIVTPSSGGNAGLPFSVTVTVNPSPVLSSTLTPAAICSNTVFSYTATTATAGSTLTWSRTTVTGITSGGAATGTDNISQTLINSTTAPLTEQYVYTISANGCTNTSAGTVSVIVNPIPVLSSTLTPATIYNATAFSYTSTSATPSTTYTWTRAAITNINSNVAGSGSDGNINEVLTNGSVVLINVPYVVTLTANGCTNQQTVTVGVSPTPGLSSTQTPSPICSGTVFGYTATSATPSTTFSWTRAAIASINSNAAGSGASAVISETLTNSSNVPVSVVYAVLLSANGFTNTQNVTVVVNPTPAVNQPTDLIVCNNTLVTPAIFTGSVAGATYSWTNNTTSIGLAVAGSGSINPFTSTNITTAPVTALITVTALSNTCAGASRTFSITVNPTPVLSSTLTPTGICTGNPFSYTATSATSGTTFSWSRTTVAGVTAGGPATGTGNVTGQTLTNSTTAPLTAGYVYTLTANGCANVQTVTVAVNPTPILTSTLSPTAIFGGTPFVYTPTSATPATVFTWARATVVGISNTTGAGTGTITETLINTTAAPLNVVYVYTLTAAGCANSQSVTLSVIPSNIDAVDDNFSGVCVDGGKGGNTASVLSNDVLNSITVDPSLVNMTITANGGITGLSINTSGELVIPAKTTEGAYTINYKICVIANPTNCDQATATINVCRGLYITTNSVCINDVPYVHYKVETNFIPASGNPVTLKWLNGDKSVLTAQPVVTNTALEANILWPGAVVDSAGNPTDWPGWYVQNGIWVAGADGFERTRPNAYLVVSVNPTDTVMLSYPPATPACAVNPVNRPPVAVNDRDSVGQCSPVTLNVLNNDSDFENGTLTVTLPSATTAHNGTAVVNINGTVTYTPPSNYEGTDTFVYTITDAAGLTASATVTIVVASKPNIVGGIAGVCALPKDSTGIYSVAPVANATGYLWTLPSGWTGSSLSNTISVKAGTTNGVITVVPYNGGCFGTPVNYNVSVIDFAKVTLTASPSTVKGDNASTSEITIQLYDKNGNLINCSGGIATLCTSSGTFTDVVDHGDGTYTAFLRSSANNAVICGSVGGVMIQQTITTTFSGPQGSIKGNGPIFETETPLLTFNFSAGIGPFTVIYKPQGATKTDTLTNVVSNVAIPVKSISATKQYTMVSIIGSDNARRDNNFTRDTATIVVVEPKIVITLTADNPKFLTDNLYATVLRLKVRNNGEINLASVQVKANLLDVFPNPVQFILDSVKQRGVQTVPNNRYDGRGNLDLFSWNFNSTPGNRSWMNNNIASVQVPSMAYANGVNSSASLTDGENSDKEYHIPFLPGHTNNTTADNDGPMTTPFFFGALSKLDVGEESDMDMYVRIIPNGYFKPFVMQAVAVGTGHTEFGTALANSLSNDDGNEALHPENTKKGDPLPTVINIFPNPVLGVAMSAGTPVLQSDGTYNVPLNYVLKNYGNVNLRQLKLLENLLRSIGSPATFNVISAPVVTGNLIANPSFDGKVDTNMLVPNSMLGVDQTATVSFTINITPNQLSALYKLQATGTGFNVELSNTISDLSTNGTDPDPDGNLIPEEKLITIIPINMAVPPLVPGTIGIQDPPSPTTVLTKTFCATTTVTVVPNVAPTGGLDPYTYQWQSSADNVLFTNIAGATGSTYTGSIAASTYLRRTVISGSQQAFSNVVRVVINNIAKPIVTASGSLNLTQSGSITLTSSAASSYLWTTNATTNSITVTTAGGYRVTVTDANGCTATSDLVAINPPPPTTVNRTYVIGAITNPPNSGVQVTGLTGATLTYYILTAGGTFIPVPVLPGVVGTTTYYVSQTVGGYESVRVPYTVTMIAPAQLADLQKVTPKAPELQADGTYLIDFIIRATNLMATQLDSVKIRDDLRAVFPASVQFAVVNVKASGKLITNELYNGNSQIELLSDGSVIPASQKDSVVITVRVTPNGFSGQLVNTAIQFAKSPYGTFSVTSNDPTYGTGLAVREPTRFVIPAIDIFIPSGFSPNRDGVNDLFVITRPFNTSINLEIFNRWGNLVYRSRDYNNDWGGKGNQPNNILGEDLPDGTYYYVVLATDKTTGSVRKFAAFITLKR